MAHYGSDGSSYGDGGRRWTAQALVGQVGQVGVRAGRTPMSPGVIARWRARQAAQQQGIHALAAAKFKSPGGGGGLAGRWALERKQCPPGMHWQWDPYAPGGSPTRGHCVTDSPPGPYPPKPGGKPAPRFVPGYGLYVGGHQSGALAQRNAAEIAAYAQAVAAMVAQGVHVPAWVAGKLSRARTDLDDVKHFLEHPQLAVGARRRKRRKRSWLARLFGRF